MNWDTNELYNWVCDNEWYYSNLCRLVGNELIFIHALYLFLKQINNKNGNEIDSAKVNGNEIYIQFCILTENENEPHWWFKNEREFRNELFFKNERTWKWKPIRNELEMNRRNETEMNKHLKMNRNLKKS